MELLTNFSIEAAVQTALQKLENDPSPPNFMALVPGQIADLLGLHISYFHHSRSIHQQIVAVTTS